MEGYRFRSEHDKKVGSYEREYSQVKGGSPEEKYSGVIDERRDVTTSCSTEIVNRS